MIAIFKNLSYLTIEEVIFLQTCIFLLKLILS